MINLVFLSSLFSLTVSASIAVGIGPHPVTTFIDITIPVPLVQVLVTVPSTTVSRPVISVSVSSIIMVACSLPIAITVSPKVTVINPPYLTLPSLAICALTSCWRWEVDFLCSTKPPIDVEVGDETPIGYILTYVKKEMSRMKITEIYFFQRK
jgi:hypothetical protein